ncbi:MAG: DegV family protein [Lachnospiraceae bacterium]|nr:DegV family protein [Lachnospiraceae bacterium]
MSTKIQITCDSTCDMPLALREKYDIAVLPVTVILGDQEYKDGVNVTCEDLFSYVDSTGKLPKTAAISMYEYNEFFSKFVEQEMQVIHISLSGELSSTYQNACIAAEDVGNVYVIDGRSLSTGSSLLALIARELADTGMEAAEIAEAVNGAREQLDVSFVLQTLEYLHKGGRCSGVAAFGANVMKLRPEIQVKNGKMDVGRKYRGSLEKSVLAYTKGCLEGRQDVDTRRVFVMHTGLSQEVLDKICALVKELQPFEEIIVGTAGCTITSHCGPDCMGVLFMKKEA